MNVRRTVFISYRRRDASGHAGRLAASLRAAGFQVFFDQTGPKPGEIFEEVIRAELAKSAVVLVVIGESWIDELTWRQAATQRGEREERDWVLLELEIALSQPRGCTIIPVLVDGAGVPRANHLPEVIKALPKRQVFELRSAHWDDEIQRLVSRLRELIPDDQRIASVGEELQKDPAARPDPLVTPEQRKRAPWMALIAAVAVLILAVAGVSYFVSPLPFWPPSLIAGQTAAEARIVEPADGSNVPGEMTAKGTTRNLPSGQTLWTVVHIGGQYWPQKPVTRIGDSWTCLVGFGGGAREHDGKKFDLLVVLADSAANQRLLDWIAEGGRTGNFPGLVVLPQGVTPLNQVTVTLKVP